MENLMIIESPNKVKTISQFLPKNFKIVSTVGHIRDLSHFGLGFNKDTLDPRWEIIKNTKNKKSKIDVVDEIKRDAKKADHIFLATDPDREGEAIAWHVYDVLDDNDKKKCKRITFNEITKKAVLEAISEPRQIDINYVYAQFARRILDRMVGYKLSNLVQRTMRADSAGRVQSLALRFIMNKENEIRNFKKSYWWTIDPIIKKKLKLTLNKVDSTIDKQNYTLENQSIHFLKEEYALELKDKLNKEFIVDHLDEAKKYFSSSPEPYKTSTLQQDAINKLNWTAKKITSIAQLLYEGIDVNEKHMALISYPRTDSTRYSLDFVKDAKKYILEKYGKEYVTSNDYKEAVVKNGNVIQDAHEAIRVIDVNIEPESLKNVIQDDEYRLYKLIWYHTVASLMSSAIYEKTNIWFENNKNYFFLTHHVRLFDGWQVLYDLNDDDHIDLSIFKVGDKVSANSIDVTEHETQPPARYTQATLIADLEKSGVGRPSTYSTMANIPIDRGYATLVKRHYHITKLGEEVANNLDVFFPEIINVQFTKEMEDRLDKITNNQENWKKWLLTFWPELNKKAKEVQEKIKEEHKHVEPEYTGEMCPLCGRPLIYRYSKKNHSKFIGCSGFPECNYIKSLKEEPKILDEKCPECNSNLVERVNKKNQKFIGCSNYPKCHYIKKIENNK